MSRPRLSPPLLRGGPTLRLLETSAAKAHLAKVTQGCLLPSLLPGAVKRTPSPLPKTSTIHHETGNHNIPSLPLSRLCQALWSVMGKRLVQYQSLTVRNPLHSLGGAMDAESSSSCLPACLFYPCPSFPRLRSQAQLAEATPDTLSFFMSLST